MALVLVLAAVALASIIGFAMLSSSALQAQASHNSTQAVQGDYLAESGIQTGFYYLQYPQLLPAGWNSTPGYYIYSTDQSIDDTAGLFDLQVKETDDRDVYAIRAAARVAPGAAPRVVNATAKVNRAGITYAGLFGGDITLPAGMSFDGPIQSGGTVTNQTGQILTILSAPLPKSSYRIPDATEVNFYGADQADGKYIMPDGTIGYAQQLLAAPTTSPVASATNPGRVFFYKNSAAPDLVLTSTVAINGTLVVKGGSLQIRAPGVTVTPVSGLPALVVERDLNMYKTNVGLEANGVVWVGQRLTWTGLLNTGTTLRINGALMMPAGAILGPIFTGGSASITFDAARVQVLDLHRSPQPGKSVQVLRWNE